nr:hypothetical protein CFP56_66240 [Quercus suber]
MVQFEIEINHDEEGEDSKELLRNPLYLPFTKKTLIERTTCKVCVGLSDLGKYFIILGTQSLKESRILRSSIGSTAHSHHSCVES